METTTEYPMHGVPSEKWFDLYFKDDMVVCDHELLCRNLTIDGNFILIGNLFCKDITIQGNCTIYGSVMSCEKVNVSGSLFILENPFTLRGIAHTGGFIAAHDDVTVGGDFLCEYAVRSGNSVFKIGGDMKTRIIECKGISVAGNCEIYPDTIWSEEPVFVLGDIVTGFPIESKFVFCGGSYTHKCKPLQTLPIVCEHVTNWGNLKEGLHE